MLDSSVLITAERRKLPVDKFIEAVLNQHGTIELSLSPVTVAELVHGIYRAKAQDIAARRRRYVQQLLDLVPQHPMTTGTAWLVGQIQGEEASKGNILPFNDLMIAASAMEQGYGVLTENIRHFRLIRGLKIHSM